MNEAYAEATGRALRRSAGGGAASNVSRRVRGAAAPGVGGADASP